MQVKIQIGNGFWSPSYPLANSFWGLPGHDSPVAGILVHGGDVFKIEGRKGPIVADDPWQGVVYDWRLGEDDGWAPALPPLPPQRRPSGKVAALQVPLATAGGRATSKLPVSAVSVAPLAPLPTAPDVQRFLFTFSRNIVGHAAVVAGAVTTTAAGNLTLRHCETINTTLGSDRAVCRALKWLPDQPDTHMLPAGFRMGQGEELAPRFTWHGFQYVIVEATPGVHFRGDDVHSLAARWTASDLEETASISFTGPGADQLAGIRDIVKASQLSNLAAFSPTDCPTREKHYWLVGRGGLQNEIRHVLNASADERCCCRTHLVLAASPSGSETQP